jgi:hypothetical protein
MLRSALLLGLGMACFGCSTLPSRYASADDEEAGLVDVTEYVGNSDAPRATEAGPTDGTPPGQTDVAWEDNGRPIRELTPAPRPEEMKLPGNEMKKKGQIVAAPDPNAAKKPAAEK